MSEPHGLRFYWFGADRIETRLPPLDEALDEPPGLLAAGGNLAVSTLLTAYRAGIFPWYTAGQPILWWSPDPRMCLRPADCKISRSLKRRRRQFEVTYDLAFAEVIAACAQPRARQQGTWITGEMQAAYYSLHRAGHAHSIETWNDGQLVGGLYGVAIGRVFFGESMFSRVSDASKVAFAQLCQWLQSWQFSLIDCQVHTDHLASLGAYCLPRAEFAGIIARECEQFPAAESWRKP